MGSPTAAIYKWWGYNIAHAVFHSKRIVDKSNFGLIYWKGMDGVIRKRFPNIIRVFITEHAIVTCGINAHLSKIGCSKYNNVCPGCGVSPEATSHIVRYQD